MCVINNILSKYLDKFKILFIYDILISSRSERDHEEHLKIVLKMLQENHLYAKFSKCDFYKHQIQYLVHVISEEGIVLDLKRSNPSKSYLHLHVPQISDNS